MCVWHWSGFIVCDMERNPILLLSFCCSRLCPIYAYAWVCCIVLQCVAVCCSVCDIDLGSYAWGKKRELVPLLFFHKNALQHTAANCNTLQHITTRGVIVWDRKGERVLLLSFHNNTLEHTATHWNTLQHTAIHYNTLQYTIAMGSYAWIFVCTWIFGIFTATHCYTLQQIATHCNTLHHTATHCNTHCNTLYRPILAFTSYLSRELERYLFSGVS